MTTRKRKNEADYINTSISGEAVWSLCGVGFTALTETPAAVNSSVRYINMASATKAVTGYDWSAPFEAEQIKDEAAVAFIINIGQKQLIGADAETELLQVDLDRPVEGEDNQFYARKRKVAVAVAEFPNTDGTFGVTGTFLGAGEPEEGEFDTTTKTFTANA